MDTLPWPAGSRENEVEPIVTVFLSTRTVSVMRPLQGALAHLMEIASLPFVAAVAVCCAIVSVPAGVVLGVVGMGDGLGCGTGNWLPTTVVVNVYGCIGFTPRLLNVLRQSAVNSQTA